MLEIAGGIILAVLFFVFLPFIAQFVMVAMGSILMVGLGLGALLLVGFLMEDPDTRFFIFTLGIAIISVFGRLVWQDYVKKKAQKGKAFEPRNHYTLMVICAVAAVFLLALAVSTAIQGDRQLESHEAHSEQAPHQPQ